MLLADDNDMISDTWIFNSFLNYLPSWLSVWVLGSCLHVCGFCRLLFLVECLHCWWPRYRPVVLRAQPLEQQCQCHLGMCQKCKLLGSTTDLVNKKLWISGGPRNLQVILCMFRFENGGIVIYVINIRQPQNVQSQNVQNLLAMQETQVQFLGPEDPLEMGIATHSSILAWKIPWIEEPGGL